MPCPSSPPPSRLSCEALPGVSPLYSPTSPSNPVPVPAPEAALPRLLPCSPHRAYLFYTHGKAQERLHDHRPTDPDSGCGGPLQTPCSAERPSLRRQVLSGSSRELTSQVALSDTEIKSTPRGCRRDKDHLRGCSSGGTSGPRDSLEAHTGPGSPLSTKQHPNLQPGPASSHSWPRPPQCYRGPPPCPRPGRSLGIPAFQGPLSLPSPDTLSARPSPGQGPPGHEAQGLGMENALAE